MGDGSSSNYQYGSVNRTGGEVEEADEFKETDLLYYKEKEPSRQEKMMKIVKIAVPIIIAFLLIGGFAWVLFKDFGRLYPGPAGSHIPDHPPAAAPAPAFVPDKGPQPTIIQKYAELPASTGSSSSSSTTSTKSISGSACAANSRCSALGLTGECCPTSAGTVLECC
jgi:hypothetical protein